MSETLKEKSEAYRWGWDWADHGMEFHHWLEPHLGLQGFDARQGFDDYHAQKAMNTRKETQQ